MLQSNHLTLFHARDDVMHAREIDKRIAIEREKAGLGAYGEFAHAAFGKDCLGCLRAPQPNQFPRTEQAKADKHIRLLERCAAKLVASNAQRDAVLAQQRQVGADDFS